MLDSLNLASIILQSDSGGGSIFATLTMACCASVGVILILAGIWMTFEKAGQAGWKCIIPIYNMYIICKIVGRPGWWVILLFIPLVDIIIYLILGIDMAKSFGKGALYGIVLLAILPFIGFLILGWGGAEYQGPAAA